MVHALVLACLLFGQLIVTRSDKQPCHTDLSVVIENGYNFTNGSLLAANNVVYQPGEFWKDGKTVRGCICNVKNCVRKCCPENHVYHESTRTLCVHKDNLTSFPPNTSEVIGREDIHVLNGDVCYYEKYVEEGFVVDYNFKDGRFISMEDENKTFAANEYCMEFVIFENSSGIKLFPCFEPENETLATSSVMLIYPIGMLISEPFLIATFLVYALIPELRNIHGKNLMSHVTSLFIAYLFLAIVQLGENSINASFCIGAAFVIYYSFLASFFWLNVMCFDLWWTFSGFKPLRGSVRERDHKKFVIYSLYCWGAPLILLVIALCMQFAASDAHLKPGFGVKSCWFDDIPAMWAYFYGPVAAILSVNLIMFITTAIKIVQLKKETAMLKGSESKRHDDEENKQQFNLYLKLFVVMGVNWVMEVISAGAEAYGGPEYLFYITDIGNTLQGVLIFIIFVWKDKIRKLIRRRFDGSLDSRSVQSTSCKSTRVFSSTRSSSRMLSLCACKCLPETSL